MASKFTTVRIHTKTRNKLDRVKKSLSAPRRELSQADTVDAAVDLLAASPREVQEQALEGKLVAGAAR